MGAKGIDRAQVVGVKGIDREGPSGGIETPLKHLPRTPAVDPPVCVKYFSLDNSAPTKQESRNNFPFKEPGHRRQEKGL